MAIESALSSRINLKLNAGTRQSTGTMIVRTIQLGKVNSMADAEKVMSVIGALAPVLSVPVFRIERQEITVLEA